jgi:hypothetical protein
MGTGRAVIDVTNTMQLVRDWVEQKCEINATSQ